MGTRQRHRVSFTTKMDVAMCLDDLYKNADEGRETFEHKLLWNQRAAKFGKRWSSGSTKLGRANENKNCGF